MTPTKLRRVYEASRHLLDAHPLAAALLAGALARLVAATVAIGFHARDDYFHVLEPALRWISDPSFDWDDSSVPGAGIRSHLVPRLVAWVVSRLYEAGISEPESVLRGIYVLLGAYSLLVVPATFFTARRLLGASAAPLAAWLAALHFAMPYAGTRLLIEALAMPPLIFGIGLLASSRARDLLVGGVAIGLACWFRFQVGAAALGAAIAVGLAAWRRGGGAAAAHDVALVAAGGSLAIAVQGAYDAATTGSFLGPVLNNIAVNLCAASPGGSACRWVEARGLTAPVALSRSGFFSYVGMWLLLTVPPATLVILPAMLRAARRLPLVAWSFGLFLALHSLIPHKEERFMLPVLPLFLLLLAAVPGELAAAGPRWWEKLRAWWPAARAYVVALHAVALLLAITSQSQKNQREAMALLRADTRATGAVSLGPEMPSFFIGRDLPTAQRSAPDGAWLESVLAQAQEQGVLVNRVLGFAQDRAAIDALLAREGMACSEPVAVDGWWLDRVIYRLNPKHNRRRSPILIWRCEVPALAAL